MPAGIPTVAIGLTNPPPGAGYQVHRSRRGNNYRKLVCRGDILVGALLVGDLDGAGVYAGLIRGRTRIAISRKPWTIPGAASPPGWRELLPRPKESDQRRTGRAGFSPAFANHRKSLLPVTWRSSIADI